METLNKPEQKETEGDTGKLKLIDFWAEWCGPCKQLKPIIEQLESQYEEELDVVKIDMDDETNTTLINKYNIKSIPTVIFEQNGIELKRLTGVQSKTEYMSQINQLLEREP